MENLLKAILKTIMFVITIIILSLILDFITGLATWILPVLFILTIIALIWTYYSEEKDKE